MYEIACLVDEGVGGHRNDDRCYIGNRVISDGHLELNDQPYVFAGVCDGVGGEAFGYEAAEAAAEIMAAHCSPKVDMTAISGLVELANEEILIRRNKYPGHAGMSSTIAGIVVHGDDMLAFNVGDSRVYRYREPYIAQLSHDHSLSEDMKEWGLEPKPGQEHVVTKYLGGACHNPFFFDGTSRAFEEDVYLLCSDGISDVISHEDFETVLQNGQPLCVKCRTLADLAIEKGSNDNLSIIIVRRKQAWQERLL